MDYAHFVRQIKKTAPKYAIEESIPPSDWSEERKKYTIRKIKSRLNRATIFDRKRKDAFF